MIVVGGEKGGGGRSAEQSGDKAGGGRKEEEEGGFELEGTGVGRSLCLHLSTLQECSGLYVQGASECLVIADAVHGEASELHFALLRSMPFRISGRESPGRNYIHAPPPSPHFWP